MASKRREHHEEHPDERWLLTYADMITLLVALFIVMFAMSSINEGKFEELKKSLNDAFAGKVMPGGQSVKEAGESSSEKSPVDLPFAPDLSPKLGGGQTAQKGTGATGDAREAAKKAETEGFESVKQKVDAIAREQGLHGRVRTRVTEDGLQIRVLTDDLLFSSGSAAPDARGVPLLRKIGEVLAIEGKHPITVSGHTDDVPISSGRFRSNWDLSVARASSVVHELQRGKVGGSRITASGRAQLDPITDNDSAAARALNRRVEILLPRLAS